VGDTVDEAVFYFTALEKQCEVQLKIEAAEGSGIRKQLIAESDAAFTASTTQ
jgi:ribulose-5-phosphate 4-epimerase/fuculose-1-phosphate aldolase